MIAFRAEATIDRPVDEVWSFLTNIERYPEWQDVENVRVLAGRPDQQGSRLGMVMKAAGRRYEMEFEIAAAEPGRRIVWRILSGGPLRGEYEAILEPAGPSSTKVVYRGSVRLTGLWRLITPIAAMEVRRGETRELERAKEILEAAPALQAAKA